MNEAFGLLCSLRLEDGRRWGDAATPWQLDDARAFLGEAGARRHVQVRPRGGSKTSDAAGAGIAALATQLPPRARSYVFAVDEFQAGFILDAAEGFLARTEGLAGLITISSSKLTNTRTGATLEVMSSDGASSWGLKPHLVICDELSMWPETRKHKTLWKAIFSSLPKVSTSRLLVLTLPGDPAHFSHKLLERARKSERWRTSEIEGPVPWLDPGDLREQAEELAEWEYLRLVLGRWVASDDKLTSVDALAACITLDGPQDHDPARDYALGLDVGLVKDATVLAVVSARDRRVRLDRLFVWKGSKRDPVSLDEVEATVLQAWKEYGRPALYCDPWQSAQLSQRLKGRGVIVEDFSFTQQSVSRLALRLHELIRDRLIDLPDDEDLLDQLSRVRLVERSPGIYRLDHEPGAHDDMAIALSLAATPLVEEPSSLRVFTPPTGTEGRNLVAGPPGRMNVPSPRAGSLGVVSPLGRYFQRYADSKRKRP